MTNNPNNPFQFSRSGWIALVLASLGSANCSVVAHDSPPPPDKMAVGVAKNDNSSEVQLAMDSKAPQPVAEASGGLPGIQVTSAQGPTPISFDISDKLTPKPAFEVPPIVVGDSFFVSTGWSWLCHGASSPIAGGLHLDAQNCSRFSVPLRVNRQSGQAVSPDEASRSGEDWRRSYSGVLSAQMLSPPWQGYSLVAAVHGENKNEKIGTALYGNTVNTAITPQSCSSGYQNGAYDDCWAAYSGFISLVFAPGKSLAGSIDTGPVIWPSMGYLTDGKKASDGVRHPYVIQSDGYLYLYYQDTSHGSEPGRKGGLEVARIKLSGSPSSLVATPYFNGGFSDSNPGLPAGFTKGTMRQFYGTPGGRASELWPASWQTLRFSVAKLRGTAYFLGVEEYAVKKDWGIRLRLSRDLVHWSDPTPVPGLTSSEGWSGGALHYPVFSDAQGRRADLIDPQDFYLLGSGTNASVVREHISITAPGAQ